MYSKINTVYLLTWYECNFVKQNKKLRKPQHVSIIIYNHCNVICVLLHITHLPTLLVG